MCILCCRELLLPVFFFFTEFKIFHRCVENSCNVRQQFTVYIPGTHGSEKLCFSSSTTSVSRSLLIIKASVSWGMCFRREKQIWSNGVERLKPKNLERILIWWWIEIEEQSERVSKMSSSLFKAFFPPPSYLNLEDIKVPFSAVSWAKAQVWVCTPPQWSSRSWVPFLLNTHN